MTTSHSKPLLISLADQSFAQTKSVGIYQVSMGLTRSMRERLPPGRVTVLGNAGCLELDGGGKGTRLERFDYASRSRLGRMWYDQVGLYRAARRFPGSVLLLPKGYASFVLPPPRTVPVVAYVHDAMQLHYRRHHPGHFSLFERTYFWRGFLATLRHARLILTNSKFTAREVRDAAAGAGIPLRDVETVGIGFTGEPERVERRTRSGVLVFVSRMPHKLSRQALEWMSRWQTQEPGFSEEVHLVGSLPDGGAPTTFENWRVRSRLEPGAFERLMDSVRAVVYFSEYEGYGMPPVEAVLAGAAPVYSDIEATREVMQGRGFDFLNSDYSTFTEAMRGALECEPERLEAWAAELRSQLDWSDVARRALSAIDRVSGGPGTPARDSR